MDLDQAIIKDYIYVNACVYALKKPGADACCCCGCGCEGAGASFGGGLDVVTILNTEIN